jgi:hypothetical protein
MRSGLTITMEVHVGAESLSDFPAFGAAIHDLIREGWTLARLEREGSLTHHHGFGMTAVFARNWNFGPIQEKIGAALADQPDQIVTVDEHGHVDPVNGMTGIVRDP